MAESITIKALQDASLDAKSLEEVVNGNEVKQVTTRKGETYPSVKKAIKTLFENGGLPATPFATKALMTASALVDGDYAQVTDDAVNNGLYVKTAGVWVKSAYSFELIAKELVDSGIENVLGHEELEVSFISGAAINADGPGPLLAKSAGREYARIDVSNVGHIKTVVGEKLENYVYVFTDASLTERILVVNEYGNISVPVPDGAVYLVRTSLINGIAARTILVKGITSESLTDIANDMKDVLKSKEITEKEIINPISGAAIITDMASDNILGYGVGRSYIKIPVKGWSVLRVSGSAFEGLNSPFVYSKDGIKKFAKAVNSDNSDHIIPEGAIYAYKTYTGTSASETSSLSIEKVKTIDDIAEIYNDVNELKVQYSERDSAKTLIAESKMPLYKLSEFLGATSDEKIRAGLAFIKTGGQGILDLEGGTHVINSALLIPSNCWLYLNDSILKLADGVFDNIIRNDGIVLGDEENGYASETNKNTNIRIFGNGINSSAINGPDVPYSAPHPINGGASIPWVGDYFGWRTMGINLANVEDYKIHGFSMTNTTCWAIVQQHGCTNFEIYDIYFDTTVKNGDGIDVLLGCSNGIIRNISGRTHDDMVAISAVSGLRPNLPEGNYIYPLVIGGHSAGEHGADINNITIQNIQGRGRQSGIRLLAQGGARIKHVAINDVKDYTTEGFSYALVLIGGSGYGVDAIEGDITNITLNNATSHKSARTVRFNGYVSDTKINNITQNNTSGVAIDNGSATLINVEATNVIDA